MAGFYPEPNRRGYKWSIAGLIISPNYKCCHK